MNQSAKQMHDAAWVERAVVTLVEKILGQFKSFEEIAIVGVRTRGAVLATRIADEVSRRTGVSPALGAVDITLYRDDLHSTRRIPAVRGTDIPFNIENTKILLVDDVLYTGRTIRAALDELVDFGRPEWIKLAVLIDRECRELPIRADFVAQQVDAPPEQFVRLHLKETDGKDEVVIIQEKTV